MIRRNRILFRVAAWFALFAAEGHVIAHERDLLRVFRVALETLVGLHCLHAAAGRKSTNPGTVFRYHLISRSNCERKRAKRRREQQGSRPSVRHDLMESKESRLPGR